MALGLGVLWTGYWLTYFGVCSLKGAGVGLLDLAIPGRTVTIPPGANGRSSATGGPVGFTDPLRPGKIVSSPPGAITDPYRSFPGGVGGVGSFGG